MIKNICNYKNTKNIIVISNQFVTPFLKEGREVGLQIADFQERKQRYKEKQKRIESIKNVIWLG